MSKLVECPECGGTGVIRLPEPKKSDAPKTLSQKIDANVTKFARIYGMEEKQEKNYKICPNCHGLGKIRNDSTRSK